MRTGGRAGEQTAPAAAGVLLLGLTACGPSAESAVEAVEEDVDEELLTDFQGDAGEEMGTIISLRAEAAIVDGADPMELGAHLVELYREHDLTELRVSLGSREDDDAPVLSVDGAADLSKGQWGEAVALFMEEEPDSASISSGDEDLGPTMRMGLYAGYQEEAELGTFLDWQILDPPSGIEELALAVQGQVAVASEGLVDWEDQDDTFRISLDAAVGPRSPDGDGEDGVELVETIAQHVMGTGAFDQCCSIDWAPASDEAPERLEIAMSDDELSQTSPAEFEERGAEDFDVTGHAEQLADAAEEHRQEPLEVLISSNTSSFELVRREVESD